MTSFPGCGKVDVGYVKPHPLDVQADARSYVERHQFDDEALILSMLGLEA